MRTQIKIFLTIALSLVMMSCSKDDYVPFVDSLEDLNNTFWEIHTLRCTTYTAGGELVEDYTHDTEDFYRADGPTPVDLYINNNTFHWFGWIPDRPDFSDCRRIPVPLAEKTTLRRNGHD